MEDPKITRRPPPQTQTQTQTPSQFPHSTLKIAVAQICQSIGFKAAKSSALETLTRIATLYLQSIAKSAASSAANSAGRPQCNLHDVVFALQDHHPHHHHLSELRQYVSTIDELPFARRKIPQIKRSGSVVFSRSDCGGVKAVRRGDEVPRWLPEFPGFGTGDNDGAKRVLMKEKEEGHWEEEERRCEYPPPAMVVKKMGGVEEEKGGSRRGVGVGFMQGRRERVKFRLGCRKEKVGLVDDLELLRSGVCRGGKRVCLIKQRVSGFLEEGDERKALSNGL